MHPLPLTRLSNLSAEWKVGGFCGVNKICTANELFSVFSFETKIIEYKLDHEVCTISSTNKEKSRGICPPLLLKPS